MPATATVLLVATTAAGGVDPAAGESSSGERAHLDGSLAPADITLAAVESPAALTEAELRRDRTRPGGSELTASGVSRLVEPADVVAGRRLEEKPPPLQLPVQGARLTAGFGDTGLWASSHTGLDFAAPEGTPLVAVGTAVVESAAYDGAFGNKVVLRLEDGTVLWYAHLSSVAVSPGQEVEAGQQVGTLGSTGNSTGPHLHLEVHPAGSGPVDPAGWLAERGLL
ncbi:M23 family metallopeptidase [Nocardioides marmoraquaticus]